MKCAGETSPTQPVATCNSSLNIFFLSLLCESSPSTPDLSAEELPDDITNEMADIPNDLELNQEDFSDVLPRLPDDLQDFDLFEGCDEAFLHAPLLISFVQ